MMLFSFIWWWIHWLNPSFTHTNLWQDLTQKNLSVFESLNTFLVLCCMCLDNFSDLSVDQFLKSLLMAVPVIHRSCSMVSLMLPRGHARSGYFKDFFFWSIFYFINAHELRFLYIIEPLMFSQIHSDIRNKFLNNKAVV